MKRKALWAAVPYTVPVMLGYLFLGAAFGVLIAETVFRPLGVSHEYVYLRRFDAVCRHQPDDLCIFSGFRFFADAHGKCKASVLRSFHVKTV